MSSGPAIGLRTLSRDEIRSYLSDLVTPGRASGTAGRQRLLDALDELAEEMVGRQHEEDVAIKVEIAWHCAQLRGTPADGI